MRSFATLLICSLLVFQAFSSPVFLSNAMAYPVNDYPEPYTDIPFVDLPSVDYPEPYIHTPSINLPPPNYPRAYVRTPYINRPTLNGYNNPLKMNPYQLTNNLINRNPVSSAIKMGTDIATLPLDYASHVIGGIANTASNVINDMAHGRFLNVIGDLAQGGLGHMVGDLGLATNLMNDAAGLAGSVVG
uniref:Secreted protein n=1 Tax=Rhabditophanes sp. KR3021 TaxID=114890 RepID=A0AC35UHF9_9BILA